MKKHIALKLDDYLKGLECRDRAVLGRAITLVESRREQDRALARDLIAELDQTNDGSSSTLRLGITGVPGVGKSTFIELFGERLLNEGHRVAVLAVDPTSRETHGSILGDKTRMPQLARAENAFIRPSPASGTLGGVSRATRESILIVEAAGFDVVLVETVGVGQSETLVAELTDFFVLLALPTAGDELQGIKKGILEHADFVLVNKADIDPVQTRQACRDLSAAFRLLGLDTEIIPVSAKSGSGVDEFWESLSRSVRAATQSGSLALRRREQGIRWMQSWVERELIDRLERDPQFCQLKAELTAQLERGEIAASQAALQLLECWDRPHE